MADVITVAIITGVLSLIGTLSGAYLANRKSAALIEYRLGQLEHKVDLHNNVIERTYALEERAAVMEHKITVADHRIADLEEVHKHE